MTVAEERVRWIEHQGKKILFHDLSNIMDPKVAMEAFARSKEVIGKCEPRSVLTLTTVANSRFNPEVIAGLKDVATHNKPYVRYGAITGVTGLLRVIFVTVTQLTGRSMTPFDTIEEAKDWLVAQDAKG